MHGHQLVGRWDAFVSGDLERDCVPAVPSGLLYEQASLREQRYRLTPHIWEGFEHAPEAIDIPTGAGRCPAASVVHEHDVRGEVLGNLAVVAPIPCCEHRIGLIARGLAIHLGCLQSVQQALFYAEASPPAPPRPASAHSAGKDLADARFTAG